jgi:hypothetical protein
MKQYMTQMSTVNLKLDNPGPGSPFFFLGFEGGQIWPPPYILGYNHKIFVYLLLDTGEGSMQQPPNI